MKYLVGLRCGGLMECPNISFGEPFSIIEATSKKEAEKIYNETHKCSYFYGDVMCSFDGNIDNINDCCSKNTCEHILRKLGVIKD